MLKSIFTVIKPPDRHEFRTFWKEILFGTGIVLIALFIGYVNDSIKSPLWYFLTPICSYAIVFNCVIGSRISDRDKDR